MRLVHELRPDALILDLIMPRLDGWGVARRLRQSAPEVKIVAITGFDSPTLASDLRALGVRGCCRKPVLMSTVAAALRAVHEGLTVYPADETKPTQGPTRRQSEVLCALAGGVRNRDIARRLNISERTVEFHLDRLFALSGARSRAGLVAYAYERGWLVAAIGQLARSRSTSGSSVSVVLTAAWSG